jgi:hypothetical protein
MISTISETSYHLILSSLNLMTSNPITSALGKLMLVILSLSFFPPPLNKSQKYFSIVISTNLLSYLKAETLALLEAVCPFLIKSSSIFKK